MLFLILGASSYNNIRTVLSTPFLPKSYTSNYYSDFDDKYKLLRTVLPPHGTVGYVTANNAAVGLNNYHELWKFYVTQYTLAPIRVALATKPEYVIGNYDKKGDRVQIDGLIIVEDFNNGVILYRHKNSK